MQILEYTERVKIFKSLELGLHLKLVCENTLRERKAHSYINKKGEPDIVIPCDHNSYLAVDENRLSQTTFIDRNDVNIITDSILPDNPFKSKKQASIEMSIMSVLTPHYRGRKHGWYLEDVKVYLLEETDREVVVGIVGRTFKGYHAVALVIRDERVWDKAFILNSKGYINPYSDLLTEVII